MAYGLKYTIPFLNRQNVSCKVNLSKDGYSSLTYTLDGAPQPFKLSAQSQDSQLPYGIKATEAVIEFYAGGIVSLIDFYGESDNLWKCQFYYNNILKWTGFLQLDNSSEAITDIDHIISLNANDGLAKLQNIYLLTDQASPVSLIYAQWKLTELFSFIFSFIPSQLQTYAFINIFETSTFNRTHSTTDDCLQQTVINTVYYINSDGTTQNLYDILNSVLTDLRMVLVQDAGRWYMVRPGDMRLFGDGAMPGTSYSSTFTPLAAVTFNANINIGRDEATFPINENQLSKILRPYKYSKFTFNYNQPPFIIQADLSLPVGATPYHTVTVGSLRYDDYSLTTYFPFWKRIADDVSYLQVVTNTVTVTEIDRYIIDPCCIAARGGMQLNPIAVTAGDYFDLTFNWRTDNDTDDLLRFWIRVTIILPNNTYYGLNAQAGIYPRWSGPYAITGTYPIEGTGEIIMELTNPNNIDTTQWMPFSVSQFLNPQQQLPPIKADGILLIELQGTNGDVIYNTQGTYWKDIAINFTQYINSSQNITGQFHNNTQTPEIKNNLQLDLLHDDSPRNSITGTLLTSLLTTFAADIGNVYFTKTKAWHRAALGESKRLGELGTYADLFSQRIVRKVIEGDFYGLNNINLFNIINFTGETGKRFVFGVATFDYMSCIFTGTFYELFDSGEVDGDLANTYLFNYIYNTQ